MSGRKGTFESNDSYVAHPIFAKLQKDLVWKLTPATLAFLQQDMSHTSEMLCACYFRSERCTKTPYTLKFMLDRGKLFKIHVKNGCGKYPSTIGKFPKMRALDTHPPHHTFRELAPLNFWLVALLFSHCTKTYLYFSKLNQYYFES